MYTILKSAFAAAAAVAALAAGAQTYDRPYERPYDRSYERPHDMRSVDTSEIEARIARQQERIDRGVARGQLTPREARLLWREHRQIERAEARAKADGRVSRWEAQRLVAMLDRADMRIRRLRNDLDAQG